MASVLTDTAPENVFDALPVRRIGPESNGMLMTPEEYLAVEEWDELYNYEIVHGVLIVESSLPAGDRAANGRLEHWLRNYQERDTRGNSLDDMLPGQELETPSGIRRADRVIWCGLGRQPNARIDIPAIAIEFVAKRARDRKRDYEEKRADYAAIGIKEYWIIDRFRRTMSVCRGTKDMQIVKEDDNYRTDLLPGFELSLAKLLSVADRWKKVEE